MRNEPGSTILGSEAEAERPTNSGRGSIGLSDRSLAHLGHPIRVPELADLAVNGANQCVMESGTKHCGAQRRKIRGRTQGDEESAVELREIGEHPAAQKLNDKFVHQFAVSLKQRRSFLRPPKRDLGAHNILPSS